VVVVTFDRRSTAPATSTVGTGLQPPLSVLTVLGHRVPVDLLVALPLAEFPRVDVDERVVDLGQVLDGLDDGRLDVVGLPQRLVALDFDVEADVDLRADVVGDGVVGPSTSGWSSARWMIPPGGPSGGAAPTR